MNRVVGIADVALTDPRLRQVVAGTGIGLALATKPLDAAHAGFTRFTRASTFPFACPRRRLGSFV